MGECSMARMTSITIDIQKVALVSHSPCSHKRFFGTWITVGLTRPGNRANIDVHV